MRYYFVLKFNINLKKKSEEKDTNKAWLIEKNKNISNSLIAIFVLGS